MTTLQKIEEAVTNLPTDEFAQFREWFWEYEATLWDRQFEQDARSGKLDSFAEQAIRDFENGQFTEL